MRFGLSKEVAGSVVDRTVWNFHFHPLTNLKTMTVLVHLLCGDFGGTTEWAS
jgi:hypothetical protein